MFHLQNILEVLGKHQLLLNQKMCHFGLLEIEYLGHVISSKGVTIEPKKVDVAHSWPIPLSTKGVRGFLRLTGYYRNSYATMAR